jgi:parvulin-like peptidyl-prolyl isomerase
VAALAVLILAGCSRQPKPDPDLVAKIGSREIRVAEFQAWMRRRAVANDPAQKAALLEEMFDHYALVQKAHAAGLDQDPELRRAWENMLVAKLREREFEPQLTNTAPSSAQIESYYQSHLSAFTEPALRRGAVLFLELPAHATEERKTQLKQRLAEARDKVLSQPASEPAARGFGALAIEYSDDQSTRYRGGDIGWIQAGRGDARFDKLVLDTLFALPQTGSVSEVLETPRGYYLLKLLELRPQQVRTLDAARSVIEHKLLLESRQRLESEWRKTARAGRKIEVFEGVLSRVQLPAAPETESSSRPPALP